jgi:hypothetical protein
MIFFQSYGECSSYFSALKSILCNTVFGICVIGCYETVLVVEVVFLGRVLLILVGAIEIGDI